MDFFESQDEARRSTARLVVLFSLAVLSIIALLHVVVSAVLGYLASEPGARGSSWQYLGDPETLLGVAVVASTIICAGTLFKIIDLRGGGARVAETLGGRLIDPESTDAQGRRLLNVVEEMAIASGVPVPPVYVLEERGINAFAAGYTPSDAVIGVTRGCIEQLDRDELQGVVAHEFSHILNGDMRINIRLIGVLHGILLIGYLGYALLRGGSAGRSRGDGAAALLFTGAGLVAVGSAGIFFGNLIKASISRQREFLADASAVQFTRDPSGLAGALAKIAGFASGSEIAHPRGAEASHMFFGRAIRSGLSGLFSTHPPIEERIARLDAGWLPRPGEPRRPTDSAATSEAALGFAASSAAPATEAGAALEHVGDPQPGHLEYARELVAAIPSSLFGAAHEPYGARAVIYALLIDADPAPQKAQLRALEVGASPDEMALTLELLAPAADLAPRARLPLVDLALPTLRRLSRPQYDAFRANVDAITHADGRIDAFEWILQRVLLRHLAPTFEGVRPPHVRYSAFGPLADDFSVVLSLLAHVGGQRGELAERALKRAKEELGASNLALRPIEEVGLARFAQALERLSEASPLIKQCMLIAAGRFISTDAEITVAEAELLRAVADTLDCPVPPLLPGQRLVAD